MPVSRKQVFALLLLVTLLAVYVLIRLAR